MNRSEEAKGLIIVARHTKFSYSKIDGTQTGQIELCSQDSFWSTTKQCPEYYSVAVSGTISYD